MTYNPSLREEPRNQRAKVLPQKRDPSILDWLESSGRLLARDNADFDYLDDEEEINELMAGDDNSFDLDDDDDDLELED
jgi:phosphopantothenoylcysteine synthetase/decarboxylase